MEIYECNSCDEGTCYNNNDHLFCNKGIAKWEVAKGYSLYKDNSGIIVQPVLEKKPELMTLQQAFSKAEDDDIIYHTYFNGHKLTRNEWLDNVDGLKLNKLIEMAVEELWVIIPAEPRVLSFDRLWSKFSCILGEDDFYSVYQEIDKNGQLKQWLNHKELRKAFTELFAKAERYMDDHNCNDFTVYIQNSLKAINNLKPLE